MCDECREHYDAVKALLDGAGVVYEEDYKLVRGLDYYTRTVFEVQVDNGMGAQNAIGGGGRYDKLAEEVDELRRAAHGDGDPEEELGDLLFAAVKAGRFLGLDSEQALTQACDKFIRRFRTVEELAPRALKECSLEELEALWARAKSHPEAQA